MTTKNLTLPLKGIIPPMITPLLNRDELDVAGLERLVERILAGGVRGLFILGTTGEAPSLSYRLRHELIDRVCRQVAGRVPILVGVTDTAFMESVNITEHAAQAGASAVVLSAPYYFPAGQPELLEYLSHLVPQLPLPVFLYNMPSHTKLAFEPDTVREAAAIPGIVGLKDSSANMTYFHFLQHKLANHPSFTLLVGPESLLAESVLLGGHGGICGGANMFPELYVKLYEAAESQNITRVVELHRHVMDIVTTIYSVGKYNSSIIKGIKCALSILGVCNDFMAEPFHRFRKEERSRIQTYLENVNREWQTV